MPEQPAFYRKSVGETFKILKSSPRGLTAAEAEKRRRQCGGNELPSEKPPSNLYFLLSQLKSPLVYILLLAAAVSLALRSFVDAAVILLVVIVNTAVGFFQEAKSARTLAELKKVFVPQTLVLRSGRQETIALEKVVPGDVIVLRPGFKVPADGRVFRAVDLSVSEAVLTGESARVKKTADALRGEKVLGERKNFVFAGTEITSGHGLAVITAIGRHTEMGKIATLIGQTKVVPTPLQRKLARFGRMIAFVIALLAFFLFTLGLASGKPWEEMFLLSVAVAVGAIPEGLLVALTVILTIGMRRILKRKALVRKLLAAETLGSTTVICADKTGTLTEGKMAVVRWEAADSSGAILAAALCNNLSDPTEKALWEKVKSSDHFDPQRTSEESRRLAEIPFSSRRKFMATLNMVKEGEGERRVILAKGAPEAILSWCKMGLKEKREWQAVVKAWGEEGLRIIALAGKNIPGLESKTKNEAGLLSAEVGFGFNFFGMAGLSDPIRREVKSAFQRCLRAGIRVVVITGDYRATAERVLFDLGMEVKPAEIMEGRELESLTEAELERRIRPVKLFARTTPEQKLRIVKSLQGVGEVVAMTGDGVNDAPALKRADIGVVVGSGTEVAKETGDLILLDDNFSTIVAAVEEGRNIFASLKKVVTYLLSGSLSEVTLVGGSLVLGFPFFILPAQILWVNLIEDGLPALALAFEEEKENLMAEPPPPKEKPILDAGMRSLIFTIGAITNIGLFGLAFLVFRFSGDIVHTRTLVFVALGIDSLFYVYACRNLYRPVWETNPFSNRFLNFSALFGFVLFLLAVYWPPFQTLLRTQALGIFDWMVLLGVGLFDLMAIEVGKHFFLRRGEVNVGI